MALQFGEATVLAGLFLVLFPALFFGFWVLWHRRGRLEELTLRRLPPTEVLKAGLRRAAEMGEVVHLSPGTGALHQRGSVAETLAGLETVQGAAQDALALGVPVEVTTNDALVNVVAQRLLEQALRKAGQPAGLPANSHFVAQQNRLAYAAGAMDRLGRSPVQGNVLVGAFEEELLLIGNVGGQETKFQVAGAARPTAAALLPLITDNFLLGEEIYAAGAYLDPRPARVVSLLVQDGMRMLLILLIVVGVILATLGMWDNLLGLLFRMPVP